MTIILNLLLSALAVFVAAYVIPGVTLDSYWTAVIVAVVLGVLNAFVKLIAQAISLPITILTFGFFSLVINVFMLYIADYLVTGFELGSVLNALLFALTLSLINSFLGMMGK